MWFEDALSGMNSTRYFLREEERPRRPHSLEAALKLRATGGEDDLVEPGAKLAETYSAIVAIKAAYLGYLTQCQMLAGGSRRVYFHGRQAVPSLKPTGSEGS